MRVAAGILTAITFALAAPASPAAAEQYAEQYTVAPHDTLYSIARHFGVPVAILAEANGLRDPSRIRAGMVLVIPDLLAAPGAQAAAARGLQPGAPNQAPRVLSRQTPPASPLRQTFPTSRNVSGAGPSMETLGMAYTVRPGDTLYHLARTHGLTVADLEAANHLSSDLIRVGQALQIPAPASAAIPLPQLPLDGPAPPLPSTGAALNPVGTAGTDRTSISALPSVRPAPPRSLEIGRRITAEATRYLGTPYVWGGASPAGVDCSGLVYLVYAPYVSHMPRASYDQWKIGMGVNRSALAPGDLVFFDTDGTGASHVGIYIGEGQFIHPALGPGRVVIDRLDLPYYAARYLGARRVL